MSYPLDTKVSKVNYLKFSLIIFSLAVLLASFFFSEYSKELLSFLVLFTALIFILLMNRRSANRLPVSLIFLLLVSFVLRSLYSYWTYETIFSPFPDSFEYLLKLDYFKSLSNNGMGSAIEAASSLHFTYIYLMFLTDIVFGTSFALLLINVFLFCVSVRFIYSVIKVDFGHKVAYYISLILLISTNLLVFTSNVLKDGLVFFLTAMCLYVYKNKKRFMIFLIPLIAALIATRIYAGVSVLAAITFDFFINNRRKTSLKTIAYLVISAMLFLLSILLIPTFNKYISISIRFLKGNSFIDYIFNIPLATLKMFFAPLPWNMFGSFEHYTFTITDSMLTLLFSFSVLLFLVKFIKYKELRVKMYLYIIPIIIHATALGLAYEGDSTRQRVSVILSIALIYVLGLTYKKHNECRDSRLTFYIKRT